MVLGHQNDVPCSRCPKRAHPLFRIEMIGIEDLGIGPAIPPFAIEKGVGAKWIRTPNSRSCHSICCGDGLTSVKFCARATGAIKVSNQQRPAIRPMATNALIANFLSLAIASRLP